MYHDVAQWTMVREKVLDKGHSRRQVAKETGLSRNTVRKMLLHKLPQPCKPRTPRHPALQQYTSTLDAFASLSGTTALRHCVTISEIYRCLKQEEGYTGSYGAVRDYLRFRFTGRQASTQNVWEQLYEQIVSISKNEAISLLQSLSFNCSPLISLTRLQSLQRDVMNLREHQALRSRQARTQQDVDWINRVLRDGILAAEVEGQYCDPAQSQELIARLRGSKSFRNRAMAILAHLRGVSDHTIATALGMCRASLFGDAVEFTSSGGVQELFTRTARPGLKINDERLKASIFALLHEPPASHGINRTTWTMAHLSAVLAEQGHPACAAVIRAITRAAGYKWRKARLVLTSNDCKYSEKLAHVRLILSGLGPDEAFFSSTSSAPSRLRRSRGAFSRHLGRNCRCLNGRSPRDA